MNIFLDFDRVIFDFRAYIDAIHAAGLTTLRFHPDIWKHFTVSQFFYDDALPFINAHRKDITIVSAMSPWLGRHACAYQKRKLNVSGLAGQVKEIVVMEGEKGPYVQERAGTARGVFVDDKLSNLLSVHACAPQVRCVQMVRPNDIPEKEAISTYRHIPSIASFEELERML